MKIESTVIPRSSIAVQSVKNKQKDGRENSENKEEEKHSPYSESLELSDSALLLNKLIHATSNQLTPCPFYFINAPARNLKQASAIAKNIQNQAKSMGSLFNYTMIYDMVINVAIRNRNILLPTTAATEYEVLTAGEKKLFEELHNTCLQHQTPINIIETAALKYVQFKQTSGTATLNKKECAKHIIESLKGEAILNHNNIKKALGATIKRYVTQATIEAT